MNMPKPEFSVFRDEDDKLFIVDGNERIVLADVFAYDHGENNDERDKNKAGRMDDICRAMNIGWSYL